MYNVHVHVSHPCKEADARQRRRNRVQLLQNGESAVARPRGLVEAVAGGQSLAALLVHYRPHDFAFQGWRVYILCMLACVYMHCTVCNNLPFYYCSIVSTEPTSIEISTVLQYQNGNSYLVSYLTNTCTCT